MYIWLSVTGITNIKVEGWGPMLKSFRFHEEKGYQCMERDNSGQDGLVIVHILADLSVNVLNL